MSGAVKGRGIVCPAGVFAAQEAHIRALTAALDHATARADKATCALQLKHAADDLLACPHRAGDALSCALCQDFSRLRANTADLILRTVRLAS